MCIRDRHISADLTTAHQYANKDVIWLDQHVPITIQGTDTLSGIYEVRIYTCLLYTSKRLHQKVTDILLSSMYLATVNPVVKEAVYTLSLIHIFNTDEGLGMLMGLMLVAPSFIALVDEGASITLFGLPVYAGTYSYMVFPVILCVMILSLIHIWHGNR